MTVDYFAVLDIPRGFGIDADALEKNYFAAQRRFHPDRLVGKSAPERQHTIAQSMQVNDAYETLKSPLKRAQHLIALHGAQDDAVKPSQELLMEIMELRETLSEASSPAAIQNLTRQNEAAKRQVSDALLQAFTVSDIPEARQLTMRLSYLMKLGEEIRIRQKALG